MWKHLNFFQYKTYLHAWVPRVSCKDHGVKQIKVPWARERSGFTLLFEAMIMALVDQMPVKAIADMVGIADTRLWRIIEYYVHKSLEQSDLSQVRRVGVDETSSRKGHKYVTLFVDLDTNKVIFVTRGKDSHTLQAFKEHLIKYGGSPDAITDFSCDLSPAFINGIETLFPQAAITFDKFHVMKLWYAWAIRSRRELMVVFAKTLKRHWAGIVRWFTSNITNKILEGLNSLIQAAKARARGFRSVDYFKLIIYRVASKLGYLPI